MQDLNITSQQDTDNYNENSSSVGVTVSTTGITGSASKGDTDSTYASVTDQSGIYAGTGGFDITVSGNTDLTGAVIASDADADKNTLTTGTLTYSDIENTAEYSSGSVGVSVNTTSSAEYNEKGITPNIGVTATGDASSTTKSAVSGTIEVKSGNADLSSLSRDTDSAVNALGKIFDKKTVAEQQEMAKLFGEVAFKAVGDLGLEEGSAEKVALDAVVGGIMSKLGGNSFASGAAGAGINQLVMSELGNIKDPAVLQWASAVVGAAAAKVVGGDTQSGASVAASATKNNELDAEHIKQYILTHCKDSIKNNLDSLIEEGIIPSPDDMTHDYYIIMGGVSLPIKFVSASAGYIVDKNSNVYILLEGDTGFGVSTFTTLTVGFGDFNGAKNSSTDYIDNITGGSLGGGGAVGVQLTASVSASGVVSAEVSGTTSTGVTLLSGRYVWYILNLKND